MGVETEREGDWNYKSRGQELRPSLYVALSSNLIQDPTTN